MQLNPLTLVILRSGLISPDILQQVSSWGITLPEVTPLKVEEPQMLAAILEEALQSEGLVLVRTTDVDAVTRYLKTARPGVLRMNVGDESAEFEVVFGRTVDGDYLIPWHSKSLEEVLPMGGATLEYMDGRKGLRVHLGPPQDLYFGGAQAFMICQAVRTEVTLQLSEARNEPPSEDNGRG